MTTNDEIRQALEAVIDPELRQNIVELDMVRSIEIHEGGVVDALRAGAGGFVLKDIDRERLVEAVRTVAAGDALFAPSVLRRLVESYVQRPSAIADPRLAELSEREREVLVAIGEGCSNAEIAQRFVIAPATVKSHVRAILAKLRLRDRVQAVVFAYETGLVVAGRADRATLGQCGHDDER